MLSRFDLKRAEDYRAFLNIHFAALVILKADWRLQDREDFTQMLGCVREDLETLGCTPTVSPILDCTPASHSRGLGISYVVRGSRLGAMILRRGVGANLPTSYLDFAPALSWAAFLSELESIAEDPNGTDEAIRAARSTFNMFATEFTRLQSVISTQPP
jgi:heme oxygenase (biliverdin-IX-beta and delta-forming)